MKSMKAVLGWFMSIMHPNMSKIGTWTNATGWRKFFHGSLWYAAGNIMLNNSILPSLSEKLGLGHRNLHYQGEAGKPAYVHFNLLRCPTSVVPGWRSV